MIAAEGYVEVCGRDRGIAGKQVVDVNIADEGQCVVQSTSAASMSCDTLLNARIAGCASELDRGRYSRG